MLEKIIILIFCHMIGDYVLQSNYIAHTKETNWYHLLVHCILYCFPFYIAFGIVWQLAVIFITHIIIDALKARYKLINYAVDQVLHFAIMCIYFI